MTRALPARRTAVGVVLAGLAAASAPAAPVLPVLTAVVSYQAAPPSVAGVQVVRNLPSLHVQVVRTDRAGLARLAGAPGVRGVSLNDTVRVTSGDDVGSSDSAYPASRALGGRAGRPGAGAGVRVAVVDTGVSDTAALNRASGRLVDGVDTSQVTPDVAPSTSGVFTDGFGHGTFMADLVAGGVVPGTDGAALGVAPGATVVVVKVAGDDGTTNLARVLFGLDWVARNKASVDVVSLSLARTRPQAQYGADPLTDAVERLHDEGITVAVSAGNQAGVLGDPGFDPKVITVGAADLGTHQVAPFSGSGVVAGVTKPDVVASGVHVLGLLPPDSVLAQAAGTVHLEGGLFRGTGTSQATAITSGLAALLLAAHPDATPSQVKASLRCAARDLRGGRDGAGLVRATTTLCAGPDGQALDGSGDMTGEASFDASSWGASSWGASSWGASSWGASSWGASSWGASSWGASSWGASSWGASSWGASSWGASSWGASSWGASSWGASSWASDSFGDDLPAGDT